ncbi:MAG TPA: hypothetical protein VFX30_03220 [bacterium]|nr:hypothetical protein [bacterium]
MTNDEKIDEVLRIVKGHEVRFDRLESKVDNLESKVNADAARSESRDHELLKLIMEQRGAFEEERQLNRGRFEVVDGQIKGLHKKIDDFRDAMTADLQAFATDLYQGIERIESLEKKLPS